MSVYTMTYRRPWRFTVHALSRAASRFSLILDRQTQLEASATLDSDGVTMVTDRRGKGVRLYELDILGRRMIAVCDQDDRTVITLLDAKRFYRDLHAQGRKRKHFRAEDSDEEE